MNKQVFALASIIASVATLSAFAQQRTTAAPSEYPTPLVREEQTVVVDGATEVWQLKWAAVPKLVCEPNDISLTCPCTGFAYGEGGDLMLIRMRDGAEIDRLDIAPFFEEQFVNEGRLAIVQRFQPDYDKDFAASQRDDFSAIVGKRPVVQLMHFGDYDHDGRPTEFYLQTEAAPCGKSVGIVIGVSKGNPRLHVFGTASQPEKALYMQKQEWEALREASHPFEIEDWPCGDHGSQTETRLWLRWSPKGIDGLRREFTCPSSGETRRLISEEPLQALTAN
jgi:hypothetical protein